MQKSRFILALFLSEALIIGLLGSTLGLVTGNAGAYILTSGVFGAGGGGGGHQDEEEAHSFCSYLLSNDLLNVWILSLSLRHSSRSLSCLEGVTVSPLEALRR